MGNDVSDEDTNTNANAIQPLTNAQVAETFELLADLLEFQDANPFRVRSYRNGARAIRDLSDSLATMVSEDPARLRKIPGIGEAIAAKCLTLLETGHLPQLVELQQQVPPSVLALLRIPGLGPKKAAALFRELGVQTLEALEQACREGKVRALKGFGAKTEQSILENLSFAQADPNRIYWADADDIARGVVAYLKQVPGIEQIEVAGSYRRGRETIGDLDVLVVAANPTAAMDQLSKFPGVATILGRGETKMSVRFDTGLQLDLRVVPRESFGAALQYFTGSKAHNVELRGRAKQKGFKINEYGVYRITEQGEQYIAGASEEEVYAVLGLPVFAPELREARQEFQWAERGELPTLIELSDVRGDLHMHTTETDGRATLEEMAAAAQAIGLEYIAITDHSPRVTMARGLNPERLRAQWQQIDQLNRQLDGKLTVLKGIECDILEKCTLDLPDDVLAEADWVLASIHYGQQQSRQQITERILYAIENPHVNAIAHPTGRILNRREAYDVDMDAIFVAAKKHGTLLELNANPKRLDLNDVLCAAARQHNIPIVINTDAHSVEGLGTMRYGILQARRGGLSKADVANTRPWSEMKALLK